MSNKMVIHRQQEFRSFNRVLIYKGEMDSAGKLQGRGELTWLSSEDSTIIQQYAGDFKNDKLHGSGQLMYKYDRGFAVYKGEFIDNQFSENGSLNLPNGDHYQGEFINSLYEGLGSLKFSGGKYEGQFIKGSFDGRGRLTLSNNVVVDGMFSQGNADWSRCSVIQEDISFQ